MNAAGKVRTQHVMTEKEAALDNALKLYFAARAEAIATGGKRPFIDDFTKGL